MQNSENTLSFRNLPFLPRTLSYLAVRPNHPTLYTRSNCTSRTVRWFWTKINPFSTCWKKPNLILQHLIGGARVGFSLLSRTTAAAWLHISFCFICQVGDFLEQPRFFFTNHVGEKRLAVAVWNVLPPECTAEFGRNIFVGESPFFRPYCWRLQWLLLLTGVPACIEKTADYSCHGRQCNIIKEKLGI